jgi:hypothetical protein
MNHFPHDFRPNMSREKPAYTLTRYLIETALCALVGVLLVVLFLPCL